MAREPVFDVLTGLVKTIFKVQGLRIDIEGQEHIPRRGGAVLAVNHTAYLDFMEVGLVGRNSGRNVRYMMKAELEHGIVGWLMKRCKAIGVDRTAGARSFERAVAALRDGEIVVVYPEATISRSFELKEFKSGAARMALAADVPIVPMIIWGAQRIWTKDIPKQLGRHRFPINIRIGEPLHPHGPADALTAELRLSMEQLLHRAQQNYEMPPGARWVPARLGGTAPTLEQAAVIEQQELARRRAAAQRRAEQRNRRAADE
ncbi:1-acyl-sn-glycerol-3-phosphate acyltransferase [Nocardia sp. CDC159]|uniref:1-acyl-sn-glycerol-3-phosphate acyltransferase n=1 Tax=Nocardia pulmonis TaxID=2951408 RepID=A0A9X2J1D3_9NOCA|nr:MULTISPECIES: lysophospholipid acyltransferase family protein [Nocardia]MCM6776876.1 1-acyl-sn-glycerol-3-phosphate acyltransferase [Nocardia pulmonis]MCM6789300.1 1-acyl-sn-glycerol-3-phosphate acyltransferase [Nocardia sp. CDC159]